VPHARFVVFDEDMPRRLSTQMQNRCRTAVRVTELGLRGTDDPDLIAILAERHPDCVLVTGNYWMPEEHVAAVRASPIAIAAIDPRVPAGYAQHEWRCDVAHRWAHSIQGQRAGSVKRYAIGSSGRWTPRIRV
jgi:hypothetical protein